MCPAFINCARVCLALALDLDGSRLGFCRFRDREPQHPVGQTRLDPLGIELARKRELALKVAYLIFLVDEAVALRRMLPLRRMLRGLGMNGQGASLEGDRHPLWYRAGNVGQQHQPVLDLVDVHRRAEGPARARALAHGDRVTGRDISYVSTFHTKASLQRVKCSIV